jgi:hypothetical protein
MITPRRKMKNIKTVTMIKTRLASAKLSGPRTPYWSYQNLFWDDLWVKTTGLEYGNYLNQVGSIFFFYVRNFDHLSSK